MTVRIARWRMRLVSLAAAVSVALAPAASNPAAAAPTGKENLPVVRDAEIEGLISDYTRPILKAAGLSGSNVQIVLLNNPAFNAFVSGRRIFVNTGTIMNSQTPNEVIGVLAHETGHLAGGHQFRLREQMESAKTIAIVAGLLGAGIMAAGASTGQAGVARAGSGLLAGGSGVAMRGLMSYQRSEETTADRSALVYLEKTHQSPMGLIRSFERLERNNLLSGSIGSQYISSHPAPRDRIAFLEDAAGKSPYREAVDPPELQLRHDMARAKIAAYAGDAGDVRRMFAKDPRGLPAAYGEAIAAHLAGSPAAALRKIDALIAAHPDIPWFHELRGEILMEAGRSEAAASAFGKALKLDKGRSGLLQASVGQALVTSGDPAKMKQAVQQIRTGLRSDPSNSVAYRFLAMAYGQMGDVGAAELATAEGYWHAGSMKEARVFAARAQGKLKPGTPQWLQAQDIITTR